MSRNYNRDDEPEIAVHNPHDEPELVVHNPQNTGGTSSTPQSSITDNPKPPQKKVGLSALVEDKDDYSSRYEKALKEKTKLDDLLVLSVLSKSVDSETIAKMLELRNKLIKAYDKKQLKEYERYKHNTGNGYYWAYLYKPFGGDSNNTPVSEAFCQVEGDIDKFLKKKKKSSEYKKFEKKKSFEKKFFEKKNQQ